MPELQSNPVIERLDAITVLLRELVAKERPAPRRLLRVAEAARYLHVSVGQLRGLVQRGELPVIKAGNGDGHVPWLLDLQDLNAWVEKAKTTIGAF